MYAQLADALRSRRCAVLMSFDGLAWAFGLYAVVVLRYEFDFQRVSVGASLALLALALLLQLGLGSAVLLYHGRAALGTFEEMLLLGTVTGCAGAVLFVVNALAFPSLLPRSVPVGAGFFALVIMAWGRALWRRIRERAGLVTSGGRTPVLVFGAGEAGRQLVRSMLRDPGGAWRVVGFIDDDPWKRNLRVEGVGVLGTRATLEQVVDETGVDTLVIAVPSARASLVWSLSRQALACGLTVKVVPSVNELPDHSVGISDVRDIDVKDILGRHQIETDVASIAGHLVGRRVLVTGAGGSIGSELCRQIRRFEPAELIMLDRDESALHAVQLSIYGRALLDASDTVLADIRDAERVQALFLQRRPEIVFHAAALKHLPMLEQYPSEAVKTNVWGTLTLLEAAKTAEVGTFVNISTDKAANPTSVLGYTKRLAEMLTASFAQEGKGHYLSVRFGNVLGSRGSVLSAFAAQIAGGGPVTVTHPDVTRYFMTVQEAVQLVVQAAAIGSDGQVLILDMGEPVSIKDVAQQLIEQAGNGVDIEFTGLRPGEKLHEELFGDGEVDRRPVHPSISHVPVPLLPPARARALAIDDGALVEMLRELTTGEQVRV